MPMKIVGYDNKGEPIWELTEEENQQWEREFAPTAKAKAQGNATPVSQKPAPGAEPRVLRTQKRLRIRKPGS
jgi:hypothetical protein